MLDPANGRLCFTQELPANVEGPGVQLHVKSLPGAFRAKARQGCGEGRLCVWTGGRERRPVTAASQATRA